MTKQEYTILQKYSFSDMDPGDMVVNRTDIYLLIEKQATIKKKINGMLFFNTKTKKTFYGEFVETDFWVDAYLVKFAASSKKKITDDTKGDEKF